MIQHALNKKDANLMNAMKKFTNFYHTFIAAASYHFKTQTDLYIYTTMQYVHINTTHTYVYTNTCIYIYMCTTF